MIGLDSPVQTVLGDAKKKTVDGVVSGLGLRTVGDLLLHFPRRYVKTGELTEVDALTEGEMLVVVGRVIACEQHRYTDRRTGRPAYRVEAVLRTDGPSLSMTFFAKHHNVASHHERRLKVGRTGIFQGKVGRFRGEWQLTNPQMVLMGTPGEDAAQLSLETLGELYPIYPLSAGVESWDLQRAIAFALSVVEEVPDLLPEELRREEGLLGVRQALEWIHNPHDHGQVTRAQQRFRFEEALVTQLVLGRRRRALEAQGARARTGGGGLLAAFDARLPFELTEGQRTVGAEVEADLARPHPMNRLLQGEVGSGKTLVALRAMLRVVDSGGQAALLAPTEVLAQQHHRSITAMLGDLAAGGMLGGAPEATAVELLTGSMTKTQRTGPLLRLASGEAGLVVGTHALLEDVVQFADLGLVVVDEQHRFGVEQRAALTDKAGSPPHVLVMTATPIPRTVAMTVFGDLETSTLTELPAGRAPIQTNVVPLADAPRWIDRVWARVREEVEAGHQAYVVCPRISGDEPEQGGADAPRSRGRSVPSGRWPRSRMSSSSCRPARSPGCASPCSTDGCHRRRRTAPCARSRPARSTCWSPPRSSRWGSTSPTRPRWCCSTPTGSASPSSTSCAAASVVAGCPGLCLLVSHAESGSPARERLDAVAATTDGFELSRVDLEQRREGDVLGASQSGFRSSLQTLRVLRDEKTILAARAVAARLLDADGDLAQAPLLQAAVADLEQTVRAEFAVRS